MRFQRRHRIQGQMLLYAFMGTVECDKMSGVVSRGEDGKMAWSAERHKYSRVRCEEDRGVRSHFTGRGSL